MIADSRITRLVELALLEDVGMGDLTSDSIVTESSRGKALFVCKESGIVAGLEITGLVFRMCDETASFSTTVHDGNPVRSGDAFAYVEGSIRAILRAERTALNFLQRMSGIATATRQYVQAVQGTNARITDTRKTAPGLRIVDKLAVKLGGGVNHRFGLDDMILIKDNHVAAAGGVQAAIEQCKRFLSAHHLQVPIEVETTSLAEVKEALLCGNIQRIMLDNFPLADMRTAVGLINHRVEVEASGGITLANVRAVAETGVDFISIGALTHSAKALDISLELSADGSSQ